LFTEKLTLFDERLVGRLGDADVREHIRAVFVPLIRQRTTTKQDRRSEGPTRSVTEWKPFQATHSQEHPAIPATRTPFNLVACNRGFEVGMSQFLDRAPDVAAFCKNAGPQALRVDYSTRQGQIAFYTADFLVRLTSINHLLVETKGRVDRDVPLKARAAAAWCKAASKGAAKWQYLYVPQETFETFSGNSAELLARTCEPALRDLLDEAVEPQLTLPFGEARPGDERISEFIADADFAALPPAHQKMVRQAVSLFRFLENKSGNLLAPVFTPLLGALDEAAKAMLLKRLGPQIPTGREEQKRFFQTTASGLTEKEAEDYKRRSSNLKRTLVDHGGMSPIGLLRECLEFAKQVKESIGPVFDCVRNSFKSDTGETFDLVSRINSFRNTCVAHVKKEPLTDVALARAALVEWSGGLRHLWKLHG
jgi:type III restriction enzyme